MNISSTEKPYRFLNMSTSQIITIDQTPEFHFDDRYLKISQSTERAENIGESLALQILYYTMTTGTTLEIPSFTFLVVPELTETFLNSVQWNESSDDIRLLYAIAKHASQYLLF
jgi:hypothetical protein